jgi:hypothetical protein
MIHNQPDGDSIASQLLRYRDGHGHDWADIIDMLTMHPEERRRVVRLLGRSTPGIDQPQIRPEPVIRAPQGAVRRSWFPVRRSRAMSR